MTTDWPREVASAARLARWMARRGRRPHLADECESESLLVLAQAGPGGWEDAMGPAMGRVLRAFPEVSTPPRLDVAAAPPGPRRADSPGDATAAVAAHLPEGESAVILALYRDGLSRADAARRYGVHRNWVDLRHARAVALLRGRPELVAMLRGAE